MPISSVRRPITLKPLNEGQVNDLTSELMAVASGFGLELNSDVASTCVQHLLYVQQVNEYMNLTRITDVHEALILHVIDSLALSRDLPIVPERFLDMGTGAGFPGIPFHILSGCPGVLLDSVGKKVDAVNAFIKALSLDSISGVHARLEEFALKEGGQFDIVFARAVGQLPTLIEYGAPFLEDDGYLVLAKANPTDAEFSSGSHVAEICGLEMVDNNEFELPLNLGHRSVLLYQKVCHPQIKLPRATGMAKRSPLG